MVGTNSRTNRDGSNFDLHVEGLARRKCKTAAEEVVELKLEDVCGAGVKHIG